MSRELSRRGAARAEQLSHKSRELSSEFSARGAQAIAWSNAKARDFSAAASHRASIEAKRLGRKSRELSSGLFARGSRALAWSSNKARDLSQFAGHAASIGVEQAKRKSAELAGSASRVAAEAAAQTRAYSGRAVAATRSWSEKARERANELRNPPAPTTVSTPDSPSTPIQVPGELVAQVSPAADIEQGAEIAGDLPEASPPQESVSRWQPVAAIDPEPRALAASALTRPPAKKPKDKKIETKAKTHRGHRGGKKKSKQKGAKSKPR
jgi:hypothetical protein